MTKTLLTSLVLGATLAVGCAISPAQAHGDVSCDVPRNQRQPGPKLQKQLREAGWNVKKVQIYNGCYEVYGFDEAGNSVEAFFDPRTLVRIPVTP